MRVSCPAAKTALKEQIAARPGLADAVVQIGLPASEPRKKERVYLTGTEDMDRSPDLQERGVAETYFLPLFIEVERTGKTTDSREACEARGWEILNEIDLAVETDPELGGAVDTSQLAGTPNEVTLPTAAGGWITKITARVRVVSMI
jgi:hypothetical protein